MNCVKHVFQVYKLKPVIVKMRMMKKRAVMSSHTSNNVWHPTLDKTIPVNLCF